MKGSFAVRLAITLFSLILGASAAMAQPASDTIGARDAEAAGVKLHYLTAGHGPAFDEKSLKTLPPGSVYSEPGGVNHFARTDDSPVIVQISGYGPTDTRYFDPANDPASKKN
jgi:hypothetical protein